MQRIQETTQIEMEWNKAFQPAYFSKKRYVVLMGGAGSGKSHYAGQKILDDMMNNPLIVYLGVRKTSRSIKNSLFQLLIDLIADYNLGSMFVVNHSYLSIQCRTGARFVSSGLDDVEKLKSIVGVNRILVEEANEISEKDFNQLDLRMRGKNTVGYQMTLLFNPVSELHWLKRMFFDIGKEEALVLKTTYKDNPFLDNQYREKLERLKDEDYQYYRIYALGEWGSIGNLIYTKWRKEKIDATGFDNLFHGLDWGFADDPFAYIKVHYDKTRRKIYIFDEIYQRGLHNDESAEEVKKKAGTDWVTCDSAEPKSIADFKRSGVKAKASKKGQGSVEHGIKWLQSHEIIVDESCINTIKELTAYKWREDKDGNVIAKPLDRDNHLLDALRYALEEEMGHGSKWGW